MWVVKVNSSGNLEWERSFGGSDYDGFFAGIRQTADGGFILNSQSSSGISGNKTSVPFGPGDAWLIKIASNGDKLWERSYGGGGGGWAKGISVGDDGAIVFAGGSNSGVSGNKSSPNAGAYDFWIVKLNANETPEGAPQISFNGTPFIGTSYSSGAAVQVNLDTSFSGGNIYYTLNGSQPTSASTLYTAPFTINSSATLRAVAYNAGASQNASSDPVTLILPFTGPYLWTGLGADNNWSTAANWSPAVPANPTTYDTTFDGATRLSPHIGTLWTLSKLN